MAARMGVELAGLITYSQHADLNAKNVVPNLPRNRSLCFILRSGAYGARTRKAARRRFATKIDSGLRNRSLHSHENEFELLGVVTLSPAARRYLPLFRYASFRLSAEFDRGSACSGASTRRRGSF
jgi:hypothetical protein